jgi:hypothetical protein
MLPCRPTSFRSCKTYVLLSTYSVLLDTICLIDKTYDKSLRVDQAGPGWSTRNVLSSVLHDKVRLTGKTDAKHAATLLMLSLSLLLSLSKNVMNEALLITIISLCALRLRKKKYAHRSRWSREWLLKRGFKTKLQLAHLL